MKLNLLAKEIGLEIDSDMEIDGLNTLKDANSQNLSFFDNKKYLDDLKSTNAGAVLITSEFADFVPKTCLALVTDEPYLKLAFASKIFAPKPFETDG